MNHTYSVGDQVEIRNHKEPRYIARVTKTTKTLVTVALGNSTAQYKFNQYGGNEYRKRSISGPTVYNLNHTAIHPLSDSPEKIQAEIDQINKIQRAHDETVRKEKRIKEEREHREKWERINAFWKEQGEEIWLNRQKMIISDGVELMILMRNGTPEKRNEKDEIIEWERPGKTLMCQITKEVDEFDQYVASKEGREPKQHYRIERGGIETRETSWMQEKVMRPSFWSGSAIILADTPDWMKELVYYEMGR